jgi:protein TonB
MIAGIVSLFLFYLMHFMISHGGVNLNESESYSTVDFIRLKRESETRLKKRVIPKKPPLPKKPPPPPKLSVAKQESVNMPQIKMNLPKISATGIKGGPFVGAIGGGVSTGDGDLIPLVKIAPRYPRKAAKEGIEGWVKVEFTVTELGTVRNPKVVGAKPKRVFDSAAKRAILKWKFKPRIVDGKPVPRKASQVLEFILDKE